MIIDLIQLTEPEIAFDFTTQPDLEEESARITKPVKTVGRLRKGIVQVDVEGRISGEIEAECTRCLRGVTHQLDTPFKAAFVTEENYTSEREAEVRRDDLDVSIYDGEKIDLTDLVREQILLDLPTQILCREDCRGLCQRCGANLNEVNCDCEETETDPRWAALKNLKK
ncbi:MAG TPA: DUF177 domain-containing protein [Pyrinomonadaceae bacterium]|jgi:uncharacterized protein